MLTADSLPYPAHNNKQQTTNMPRARPKAVTKSRSTPVRPLPTDAMCIILSRINVLDRIRIMTTCRDWYSDIRECCARQTTIAFYVKQMTDFRQCNLRSHQIPENNVVDSYNAIRNLMSDPVAIKSFHKLFPNLTVIKAGEVRRDFLAPYVHRLECLNVVSISWTRAAPQIFENLTCLHIHADETANIRLSAKTFPRLKTFIAVSFYKNTRNPGIEPVLKRLPVTITRLECCARNMDLIGKAHFAVHLTHLRIELYEKWTLRKDLILQSLKSLVIRNNPENGEHAKFLEGLILHLKAPKLQAFGLFSFNTRDSDLLKRLLCSLPKLNALALNISWMSDRDLLETVIQCQPQIRLLHTEIFPGDEEFQKIIRLRNLRIFTTKKMIKELEEDEALHFLRNPFMLQLTHFRTVNLFNKSYGDDEYPESVLGEIQNLKNGNLKLFEEAPGYLWDDFITQMPRVIV